jgi:integrase
MAKSAKKKLTDRFLRSLKPAPKGTRYDVWDTQVAGLLVRVTERGVKSFALSARLPGKKSTRRSIGIYSDVAESGMTLKKARATAQSWKLAIDDGRDPIAEEAEKIAARRRRAVNTFAGVAEDFIALIKLQKQRKARELEQDIRREFIKRWGDRPVTAITSEDVREIIKAKAGEGHKAQAYNLLGTIRRIFNWAVGEGSKYGLDRSPCDKLQKPKDLIGAPRAIRERTLKNEELIAFWRATGAMGYPYAQLLRLLLVTAQRQRDIAAAVRSELDLSNRPLSVIRNGERQTRELGLVMTIPADRMKMKRTHVVPLSQMAVDLFRSLPQFTEGPHLFSTTFGVKSVNGFAKAKTRLDSLMLDELRRMATDRGEDPNRVELSPWVLHDLRRTARSAFSMLRIPPAWAEHVIAHVRKGLDRSYDQWQYLDEKREALDEWADHLRSIVEPLSSDAEGQHTSASASV